MFDGGGGRRKTDQRKMNQDRENLNLIFILLLIHFTSWISKDGVVKNHKGAEQNAVSWKSRISEVEVEEPVRLQHQDPGIHILSVPPEILTQVILGLHWAKQCF